MRRSVLTLSRLLLIVAALSPVAAWALYKPMRVMAPQFAGAPCIDKVICTNQASRQQQAAGLYTDAYEFVASHVGEFRTKPRVVFCSTETCSSRFGLGKSAAKSVGTSGIVVGPRAWQGHYIRHEMIHHLQAERLSLFGYWLTPAWFKEGMAYALSGDPRSQLAEPFQQYREDFQRWYKQVGTERIWDEAQNL